MRIASVALDGRPRIAISGNNKSWRVITQDENGAALRSVKTLIEKWQTISISGLAGHSEPVEFEELQLLCPLKAPEKIICVGKNYPDHATEMGGGQPDMPVIFNKLTSSLIGPGEVIELPKISKKVDYEAELVVVIGKTGRLISIDKAMDHVFGYTIGNDVSARDWQKGRPGGQWFLGKSFDTFAPVGPYIVTAGEIDDPQDLDIELRLNGKIMQKGNTSEMTFRIDRLIAHVSQFFTLRTGDLIFTGTPAGVGAGRSPEVYLAPNDSVEVSISGIGKLSNTVAIARQ